MRKQALIIAVLSVFALTALFSACGIKTYVLELKSIDVNTENAKTEYFTGDDFTDEGIEVTAEIAKATGVNEKKTLSMGEYEINSASFNKYQPGVYRIVVSYTLEGVTKKASYDVTVTEREYDGLSVSLKEGETDTYRLTAPFDLDVTKISVKETDSYGNLTDAEVQGYTTKLFKGKKEIAIVNGKARITEDGAYQIWVEKASDVQAFYVRKAFVTVYVLDDVKTLAFDSSAEGTLTTQTEGKDEISETWKFIVTYESGKTKVVGSKDVKFITPCDTSAAGENLTATATYTEKNAKAQSITTTEADVTYSVTAKQQEESAESTVTINASDLETGDIVENKEIAKGITVMATALKKVVVDANNKTYGELTFTKRMKLGGKGNTTERSFKIEAKGKGTVTLYAITGSSSDLGRKLVFADATGTEIKTSEGLPNEVTEVVFDIPSKGTYYVYGTAAINVYYVKVSVSLLETVNINASDLETGDIVENKEIAKGITVMATASKNVVVDANNKTYGELTFTKRMKLGGKGNTTERSFKIEANSKGTVTLYAITGSSSDLGRKLVFADATGTEIKTSEGLPNVVTEVVFDIPSKGTYYVYGTAAVNVYYISLTHVSASAETTTDNYEFSYSALTAKMTEILGAAPADPTPLKSEYFTDSNEFLTFVGTGDKSDQYRKKGGGCVEIKKGYFTVTFKGTGTLTVSFASTSGTNASRLAVTDANGNYVTATGTATVVTEGDEAGAYEVQGTAYVAMAFEITQPGTYTICCKYVATGRGMRVKTVSMTDVH